MWKQDAAVLVMRDGSRMGISTWWYPARLYHLSQIPFIVGEGALFLVGDYRATLESLSRENFHNRLSTDLWSMIWRRRECGEKNGRVELFAVFLRDHSNKGYGIGKSTE